MQFSTLGLHSYKDDTENTDHKVGAKSSDLTKH